MSRSYWLPYVAAGIGIGIVISLLVAIALHNYQRAAECEYYSAEPYCQSTAANSPSVRLTPSQREHGPNPDPYAERKEWREEQDLKSQRQMAEWAFWAVMAALGSVAVTGIGVILVAFTLEETRKAVAEAAKASEAGLIASNAAKSAADASFAAERARFFVVIDKDNFSDVFIEVKNRPRIQPPRSLEGPMHRPPKVYFRFRNYGRTPGIINEVCLGMSFGPEPMEPVYNVIPDSFSENMIGNGDYTDTRHLTAPDFSYLQAEAVQRNEARLWFYGKVIYDTVFGQTHTHRFYFRTVYLNGRCFLQSYDYKHHNQSS